MNVGNDAGWAGSAGPWITPELSMQKVVWTETAVCGQRRFERKRHAKLSITHKFWWVKKGFSV
jgi:hypothetical protein